ncbi:MULTISPECIES: hypothetical protein [unclassified Frankia]|uniref:carboxymuconolactone decarboxylase family protein n=1 Tax=unclassified Frankia TaxID=2632575 RepID=UPI002AD2B8F4|nr:MULTISPECIES: hypothetical protein [unclassified Frankia]
MISNLVSADIGLADHSIWRLPGQLCALRPDATQLLDRVNEHAWRTAEPALLELMRLRVACLIGNRAGEAARSPAARTGDLSEAKIDDLPAYPTSTHFSPVERECLAFAEQFVMDVSGMTTAALDVLAHQLGRTELSDFVGALYAIEFTQRLQMVAQVLLAPVVEAAAAPAPTSAVADTAKSEPHLDLPMRKVLATYQDAVVRGQALDSVTTELVRLRCARTHRCRICQTLRLADAQAAGVDETMTAKIDFYERSDLPERFKVALRITDAFITRPDSLSETVAAQARSFFSSEQLAELCLDITKWSTQKINVALGTDGADRLPTNKAGVSFFGFDDAGRVAGFWAN